MAGNRPAVHHPIFKGLWEVGLGSVDLTGCGRTGAPRRRLAISKAFIDIAPGQSRWAIGRDPRLTRVREVRTKESKIQYAFSRAKKKTRSDRRKNRQCAPHGKSPEIKPILIPVVPFYYRED